MLQTIVAVLALWGLPQPPENAARPTRPAKPPVVAPKAESAEPYVELPAEILADPGRFVPIKPKTNGKSVVYHAIDPQLSVFPSEMLRDPRQTVVVPPKAGRYRLLAYTAVGDVASPPAIVVVVAGKAPPDPVDPVDPVDPTDPKPGPRPAGFAGEVYDQALLIDDPRSAAKLGQVFEAFSSKVGVAPLDKPAAIPAALTAAVKPLGLPKVQWETFTIWLTGVPGQSVGQLSVRAPTVAAAKSVLMEVAQGLKAAGGVK